MPVSIASAPCNVDTTQSLAQLIHELRTPISAIMGFSKINRLTDELGREQRVANSVAIERNCEALLALIDRRLDQDRVAATSPQPDLQAAEPDRLLADVIETAGALTAGKPIGLTLSIASALPPRLVIDAPRLRQVLLNLLGNAVKFTEQGEVRLDARWAADTLTLTIEDTGVGIPPEAIDRVWEPWQQAEPVHPPARGGSGLGLSIARELVQIMGGTIGLTSRPGQGTRIELCLPARAAIIPSVSTVLIAEDNVDLRDLLALTLRRQGMTVVTAPDGLGATEAARLQRFDLVVLDLEMPLMTGFETAQVLRLRGFDGPLAGLSARLDASVREQGYRAGFDRLLEKPISPMALVDALLALHARPER